MPDQRLSGNGGALAATGAFSIVGSLVAISALLASFPIGIGQAARYALAATVLLALARTRLASRLPAPTGVSLPSSRDLVRLALLSTTGLVLFNVCLIEAVDRSDPASVGVIVGCLPIVLAVLGPIQLGRRPELGIVAAAGIVVAGAAIVHEGGGGSSTAGLLLALGALAGEACFALVAVPALTRLGPLSVSAWACLWAVPLSLLWSVVAGQLSVPTPSAAELAALVYQGVVVSAGGFVLWYSALSRLGSAHAGLFAGVLPIATLAFSALIGAEAVTATKLVGVAVVAGGITLGMRWSRPGARRAAAGAIPPAEESASR